MKIISERSFYNLHPDSLCALDILRIDRVHTEIYNSQFIFCSLILMRIIVIFEVLKIVRQTANKFSLIFHCQLKGNLLFRNMGPWGRCTGILHNYQYILVYKYPIKLSSTGSIRGFDNKFSTLRTYKPEPRLYKNFFSRGTKLSFVPFLFCSKFSC
ncbi:hypothetical protein P308_01695 [Pseudomonas piscis]|nr:hypothetical protein P308_01695 [Pseudomonas piscis]